MDGAKSQLLTFCDKFSGLDDKEKHRCQTPKSHVEGSPSLSPAGRHILPADKEVLTQVLHLRAPWVPAASATPTGGRALIQDVRLLDDVVFLM